VKFVRGGTRCRRRVGRYHSRPRPPQLLSLYAAPADGDCNGHPVYKVIGKRYKKCLPLWAQTGPDPDVSLPAWCSWVRPCTTRSESMV